MGKGLRKNKAKDKGSLFGNVSCSFVIDENVIGFLLIFPKVDLKDIGDKGDACHMLITLIW